MWPTRAGATADRRQEQQQRGAVSSTAQQRGAAVQQHAGARDFVMLSQYMYAAPKSGLLILYAGLLLCVKGRSL